MGERSPYVRWKQGDRALAFAGACLGATWGCGSDSTSPESCGTTVLVIGVDSLVTLQGESILLTPALRCGTTVVAGTSFTFAVADSTVASVSADGLVTALAGGRTSVVVSTGEFTDSIPVVVYGHPAGVSMAPVALSGTPFGAAVSRTGTVYVTRYTAPSLARYQLPDLTAAANPGVPESARDVEFSPAGDLAFVANRDQQQVTIVNVGSNSIVGAVAVGGHPLRLLPHPDGQVLFVTSDLDSVFKIDIASRTITDRFRLETDISGSGPTGMVYTADGTELIVSSLSGFITTINVATATITDTMMLTQSGIVEDVALSPSGDTVYAAVSAPNGVYLFDRQSKIFLTWIPLATLPFSLRLSPDSTQLYAAGGSTLYVVNRQSLAVTGSLSIGGVLRHLAFDRYGRSAVIADEEGFVHLIR